jgi:hypothetical protein
VSDEIEALRELRLRFRRHFPAVRAVLVDAAVLGVARPEDEYDALAGPLVRELLQGAGPAAVTAWLARELREHHACDPAALDAGRVAERVVAAFRAEERRP